MSVVDLNGSVFCGGEWRNGGEDSGNLREGLELGMPIVRRFE